MLVTAHVLNSLGMILLPLIALVIFKRRFKLAWKLALAGGLTFIASQILHLPLVLALTPTLLSLGIPAYAAALGLLAGLFEEGARYLLFKFLLKKINTWKQGIFVGLGHGGVEAILLGISAALVFVNMLVYRNLDLSTVPGIPPEQLELAKGQVAAYWALPPCMALLGAFERLFAMCLHVALSVMVLYSIVYKKPSWFWLAILWHALVDAVAVYLGQHISMLAVEGVVAVFAMVSVGITLRFRLLYINDAALDQPAPLEPRAAGTGTN